MEPETENTRCWNEPYRGISQIGHPYQLGSDCDEDGTELCSEPGCGRWTCKAHGVDVKVVEIRFILNEEGIRHISKQAAEHASIACTLASEGRDYLPEIRVAKMFAEQVIENRPSLYRLLSQHLYSEIKVPTNRTKRYCNQCATERAEREKFPMPQIGQQAVSQRRAS